MQAICSSLLLFLLPFACTFEVSFVSSFSGIHAVLILLVSCNINKKINNKTKQIRHESN
jgi:hypothetical protein